MTDCVPRHLELECAKVPADARARPHEPCRATRSSPGCLTVGVSGDRPYNRTLRQLVDGPDGHHRLPSSPVRETQQARPVNRQAADTPASTQITKRPRCSVESMRRGTRSRRVVRRHEGRRPTVRFGQPHRASAPARLPDGRARRRQTGGRGFAIRSKDSASPA